MPSAFASQLANIARALHDKFHLQDEGDPPLSAEIRHFWEDLGFTFPGVEEPWSAVFVSSCVFRAGAKPAEFRFAPLHSVFVHEAIKNADSSSGVFRGRRLNAHSPAVGDIIQNNRGGSTFDFQFAKTHAEYPSHSAIVVERGHDATGEFALTIGGNEGDSIRRKKVRLSSDGFVLQKSPNPFICIIENLK